MNDISACCKMLQSFSLTKVKDSNDQKMMYAGHDDWTIEAESHCCYSAWTGRGSWLRRRTSGSNHQEETGIQETGLSPLPYVSPSSWGDEGPRTQSEVAVRLSRATVRGLGKMYQQLEREIAPTHSKTRLYDLKEEAFISLSWQKWELFWQHQDKGKPVWPW